MPKATLLGPTGATYHFGHLKRTWEFTAGVPQDVPVAVALALAKKHGRKGKPLFEIEEMPVIVQPMPEQNVDSAQLHQPRFIEPWPSEQQ